MANADSTETLNNTSEERLSASVGCGGANRKADVLLIQQLINDRLPVGFTHLYLNGVCDDATIAAIDEIQRRIVGFESPDGRIDPDGRTFRALTSATPVPKPQPGSPFPDDVIAAAQASHRKWNIPASVTLAQWALESNWGRSMPLGSNNPFGIKAAAGQPFVEAITHEHINGRNVTISARFRKFDSIAQAFDEHGKLLGTRPQYAHAREVANNNKHHAKQSVLQFACPERPYSHLRQGPEDR